MIPDWVIYFEAPILLCGAVIGFNSGRYLYIGYDKLKKCAFSEDSE